MTSLTDMTAGTTLPPLELPPIDRTTLALYAGASGDHNPLHIDLDVALQAGFEDVFAHGMLSMGYLGRLLTNWVPQERIRSYSVRFTEPTPVHAKPVCSGQVTSIEEVHGERCARLDLRVVLEDGTETLHGEAFVSLG